MKTAQDYMNDSRLLNDPGMAEALEPVREIHAARLMIQDETAGMTATQKSEYLRKNMAAMFAGMGLPLPQIVSHQ
ncbi:MAG: hypothetical protein LBK61_13535 [Spirochaetaceae bacterium]|jgi:hypothetical protein|nr:hypothetical protein [Spirochaetaceae bacterium]